MVKLLKMKLIKIKVVYWWKFWSLRIKWNQKIQWRKQQKRDTFKILHSVFKARGRLLEGFERGIFPLNQLKGTGFSDLATRGKVSDHSNFKMLSPQKMVSRFPIALAQVKARNTSKNLLNESVN